MNICILTRSTLTHEMGGTQVHCEILSETAVKMGHSVKIITTKHPHGLQYEQKKGFETYYLQNTRPARLNSSWWEESVKKINQLNKAEPFDIIWAENLAGYYYALRIKPLLRVPVISINNGLGILGHIRSEWGRVSTLKELFIFVVKRLPEAIFFYLPWFWITLKYSDVMVGVSDQTIEAIKREFPVKKNKLFVIYDSIDTQVFKPDESKREAIRKKFSLNKEDKVLLMAGVVHKQKGMHIGLKAFVQIRKEVQNSKLMVVGDGPHLDVLKRQVEESGINKDVIFCGLIPNEETPFYYNACDVFLNPTIRQEGLALVTVEAMSCCKPVVVSRIGGTQSTIDDGVSGFFVKPKDIKSLTEKTIEILKSPSLSKKMGENGRKKVLMKFSKEKMISNYLNISQKLINKKE